MEYFLTARDLTFRYFEKGGHVILDHVDFDLPKGKTIVLLGKSGSGKSTLLSVLGGLYPENGGILLSGEIEICGKPLPKLRFGERASYVSEMFQNPDLQFCMDTLRKEMIFCLENISRPREEMDGRVDAFAKAMKIEKLLDQPIHSLSGGEKQKAALCCLLLLNSKGIFLDEPFANLDERSAGELQEILKKHQREQGTTILAIDHRIDLWLPYADEFWILGEKGRILKKGITRDNWREYRQLFLEQGLFYPHEKKRFHEEEKTETLLSMENLTICRGKSGEALLLKAQAEIPKQKFTALLGPSGCGKTTLFSAILGQKKYGGSILLEGQELRKMKSKLRFRKIGTVFQNPSNQFLSTRVLEEVLVSLKVWNPKAEEQALTKEALSMLDSYQLKAYQKYSPYMLSQGQQRRLAVLSILAGGQKLLLLDEPTYGQDYASTTAIMEQLRRLVKEEGLTVLFTTHDRQLAAEYADRIYEVEGKELRRWKD